MKRKLYIAFLLLLSISSGWGQSRFIEERVDTVIIDQCEVATDTLSIIPSSIFLSVLLYNDGGHRSTVDTISYSGYSVDNNQILLDSAVCRAYQNHYIILRYRVFPFNIEKVNRSEYINEYKSEERIISYDSFRKNSSNYSIIESDELDYNGSFSRGLSLGNSQDFLLNSKFNMTMSGEIGDGIHVVAAISDQNLPIQPQGNTQLIQDFDRVFIQVSKDSTSVIAGDYTIPRPKSYFINTWKKIKGLQVKNTIALSKSTYISSEGNVAVSRGKYARHTLQTTEGNQGPYRLKGNENDRFIIVLSGTERVYLDGKLLTRGFNNDYVINYNTAEITFTPQRFIGPESRIIIEYEYRDQNYLRTLYTTGITLAKNNLTSRFYLYSEQDSKNALGDITLDSLDYVRLQNIGDNIESNYINSIKRVEDTTDINNYITYALMADPLSNDSILVYNTDRSTALYIATFTEVGRDNGGAYKIDTENRANGRVYTYVGAHNGDYLPVIPLTPPEKKQMMSFNLDHISHNGLHTFAEFSLSYHDVNRYSDRDNNDNIGMAGKITVDKFLYRDTTTQRSFLAKANIEIAQKNFKPLNIYRSAEFNRDWNTSFLDEKGDEVISTLHTSYQHNENLSLSNTISHYNIKDIYDGLRNVSRLDYDLRRIKIEGRYNRLSSSSLVDKTIFNRPSIEASIYIGKELNYSLSVGYDAEYNRIINKSDESTSKLSGRYEDYHVGLDFRPNDFTQSSITARRRYNYFVKSDQLEPSYLIDEAIWSSSLKNRNQFVTSLGLRSTEILDKKYEDIEEKISLIGKLSYDFSFLNKFIEGLTVLNSLSGQEPKTEYVYEKVEAGQGSYIYIGHEDTTLINANFRYAPDLGTADYIRLNQFNNEYVLTQNTDFNQSLKLLPKQLFKNERNRILSRFSTLHNLRYAKKTTGEDNAIIDQLNVLRIDSSIVTYNSTISHTLFFNKGQAEGDARVGYKKRRSIYTQIAGEEERNQYDWFTEGRWNTIKTMDILLYMSLGQQRYRSEINPERDYHLNIHNIKPSLSIRFSDNLRWIAAYKYAYKKDVLQYLAKAINQSISSEITFRSSTESNLNVNFSYTNVAYKGEKNSILEFELLEGLKDGHNFQWNIGYTRRMINNIDLNIHYEGRKNGAQRLVNIGRAQIKATF